MNQSAAKIPAYLTRAELKISLLVFIVYAVGIAGITIPLTGEFFVSLIPVVLVLSLSVSLAFHRQSWDLKTIALFSGIIFFSWVIEAAGVKTGIIFGNYTYGPALGPKLLETPLLIGLNWLFLIYGTAGITETLPISKPGKVLSASLVMVVYDLILERVAPLLGMWQFEGGIVPTGNYVAWLLVAGFFHSILRASGIKISNRVAPVILGIQLIFFLALILIFHFTK